MRRTSTETDIITEALNSADSRAVVSEGRLNVRRSKMKSHRVAVAGVAVAVIFGVIAFFTPEFRRTLGLDGPARQIWLGVSFATISPDVQKKLEIPDGVHGVLVGQITPSSPAANTGLTSGDIITRVNGRPVTTESEFKSIIQALPAGAVIKLSVWRDSQTLDLMATLGTR
jgi:S1-C subfamily serine protease